MDTTTLLLASALAAGVLGIVRRRRVALNRRRWGMNTETAQALLIAAATTAPSGRGRSVAPRIMRRLKRLARWPAGEPVERIDGRVLLWAPLDGDWGIYFEVGARTVRAWRTGSRTGEAGDRATLAMRGAQSGDLARSVPWESPRAVVLHDAHVDAAVRRWCRERPSGRAPIRRTPVDGDFDLVVCEVSARLALLGWWCEEAQLLVVTDSGTTSELQHEDRLWTANHRLYRLRQLAHYLEPASQA